MRSAMKSLLADFPLTMRPILKIHNFAQSAKLLAPSCAHGVPTHFRFLRRTAIEVHFFRMISKYHTTTVKISKNYLKNMQ